MSKNFSHLIESDYEMNEITIYRIFPDGEKQLFTSTNFPAVKDFDAEKDAFSSFAQILGENILLDSPVARKKFKID